MVNATARPRPHPGVKHCTGGSVGPKSILDRYGKSRTPTAIRLPYSPSRSESPYWLSHPRILKYVVPGVTSMYWISGATFYSLVEQVRVTCTFLSSQTSYVSVTAFLDEMFFNREDESNICSRNVGACYATRRDNPEYLRLTLTRTVTRFSNVTHTPTYICYRYFHIYVTI